MNSTVLLFSIGSLIVLAMLGYLISLLLAIKKQKRMLQQAYQQRLDRLQESIVIIAKAMLTDECNHSEGVLRLKPLLEAYGKIQLNAFPAMYQLYLTVREMPIKEERQALAKKERRQLDRTRESTESKLEQQIKSELPQLLEGIK
ncbi:MULTISPECIES: DUF2489 domain-containing protein [Gallibacterium]|uniref:DUF2489 domain-containing protein n=1 Tax=Gallibacterium genomosp. 3 TaxID=505345 RepID=A0A1A7NPZ3_9PAST|nr:MULTISPECIES: DUF2489 domain-containing protein [Gallibacterium]MDA3978121.1 DUF2489 domain-containing protein [Gallibacterium sp. AGMB14963]OBW91703.1 hypothetical protein QV01_06690 [Gallibacterium genomosp. 3]OBX04449.1 hypothetical protein QV06_07280 [Gallibacterium genomosp. 3]